MRTGRRSNSSIGRFARLFMRNIGGWRIPPAETDKGTIAQPMNVALAENESATRALGWPTYAEERGFGAGESVVTVTSVVCSSPPIYTSGTSAADHAERIADVFGRRMCAYWVFTGYRYERWSPFLIMSPSVAERIAGDGWSKDDLRRYLRDNVWETMDRIKAYAHSIGITRWEMSQPLYESLVDDQERLPVFPYPERIGIILAGDPGRNQTRGYLNNHQQGSPTSRAVRLPGDWKAMLQDARQARIRRLSTRLHS
jgi:hypothetical protein